MQDRLQNNNVNEFVPGDAVESALRQLQPRESRVNKERLLFLIGRAAGRAEAPRQERRRNWFWPSAALLLLAACVGLTAMYTVERRKTETLDLRLSQLSPVDSPHDGDADRTPREGRSDADARMATNAGANNEGAEDKTAQPGGAAVRNSRRDRRVTEATLWRTRYPILATNVDWLPASTPRTTGPAAPPKTLQDYRLSMLTSENDSPEEFHGRPSSSPLRLPWLRWLSPSSEGTQL